MLWMPRPVARICRLHRATFPSVIYWPELLRESSSGVKSQASREFWLPRRRPQGRPGRTLPAYHMPLRAARVEAGHNNHRALFLHTSNSKLLRSARVGADQGVSANGAIVDSR